MFNVGTLKDLEPSSLSVQVSQIFLENGKLSQAFAGFRPRVAQTELATAIAQSIENSSRFVAEAGTGVGKTFAYLVPALLCGKK